MFKHFPRLTTIALSYAAAALLLFFLGPAFFQRIILPFGIFGVLIAGGMYTYSFTSAIGAVLLIALAPYHPAGVIAVVGGIGGAMADFSIFKFIKHDLQEEVKRITSSKAVQRICGRGIFCKRWFRNIIGIILLASPIPDEFAIAFMSVGKTDRVAFILLTFIADAIGIYFLVSAAVSIVH